MTEQAAATVVAIKRNRTFRAPVPVYLGKDEANKDIKITIPTTFKLLPADVVREIQEDGSPFLGRVLVTAEVSMLDDDGNPLPDQREAILNDPAISTAMVNTYIQETTGKNSNGRR